MRPIVLLKKIDPNACKNIEPTNTFLEEVKVEEDFFMEVDELELEDLDTINEDLENDGVRDNLGSSDLVQANGGYVVTDDNTKLMESKNDEIELCESEEEKKSVKYKLDLLEEIEPSCELNTYNTLNKDLPDMEISDGESLVSYHFLMIEFVLKGN